VRGIIRFLGFILFLLVGGAAVAYLAPWGKGMMENAVSGAAVGELTVSGASFQGNPLRGMSVQDVQISEKERMVITVPNALVRLDFLKPGREIVAIFRDFEARFARKQGEAWALHLPDRPVRLLMANGQFSYVWNEIPIKGMVNGEIHILPDKVEVKNLDLFAFSAKAVTTGVYERGSGNYHYETKVSGISADTLTLLLQSQMPDLKELQLGAVMDGNLQIERKGGLVGVTGTLTSPRMFLRRTEWKNLRADIKFGGLNLNITNGSGEILGGRVSETSAELVFPREEVSASQSPLENPGEESELKVGVKGAVRRPPTTYSVSGNLQGVAPKELLKLLGIAERTEITGTVEGSFKLQGILGDAINSSGRGKFLIQDGECTIPGEDAPVKLKTAEAEWEYEGDIFKVKRLMIASADEDFYIAGQVLLDRGGRNAVGTGVVIVREADTLKSLPDEVKRLFRLMNAPVPSAKTRKMALVRLRGDPRMPGVYFTPGPTNVIELSGETFEERLQSVWQHYQNSRLSLF
jgi:hypothetical protein